MFRCSYYQGCSLFWSANCYNYRCMHGKKVVQKTYPLTTLTPTEWTMLYTYYMMLHIRLTSRCHNLVLLTTKLNGAVEFTHAPPEAGVVEYSPPEA